MTRMHASGEIPEWSGKYLLIYLSSVAPSCPPCVSVAEPRLEQRAGRQFLVGVVPESVEDWAAGLRVEVAWDQVAHVLVLDTLEEYQNRIAEAPAYWEMDSGRRREPS